VQRSAVAEDGRRTCLVEDRACPHEQPSPDDPAEADHRHVPPLQALLQVAFLTRSVPLLYTSFSHASPLEPFLTNAVYTLYMLSLKVRAMNSTSSSPTIKGGERVSTLL
jgi:hypothetical protein